MSLGRVCIMIAAFALIAMAAVYIRAEQTRCAARTLAIESEVITERRELWRLQSVVARLRAPGHIRDRMDWFQSDLEPPGSIGSPSRRSRLASGLRSSAAN